MRFIVRAAAAVLLAVFTCLAGATTRCALNDPTTLTWQAASDMYYRRGPYRSEIVPKYIFGRNGSTKNAQRVAAHYKEVASDHRNSYYKNNITSAFCPTSWSYLEYFEPYFPEAVKACKDFMAETRGKAPFILVTKVEEVDPVLRQHPTGSTIIQTRLQYTVDFYNVGQIEIAGVYQLAFDPMSLTFQSIPTDHMDCPISKSAISYVNGISTTYFGARESLIKLKDEFGNKYKYAPLEYKLLHNQTSCGVAASNCLADLAEVFEQRQAELNSALKNRWEIFWDTLAGRHEDQSSATGNLASRAGAAFLEFVTGLDAALRNKAIQLTTAIFRAPMHEQDLADHLAILNSNSDSDISTTIVAHSQGNLFANELKNLYSLKSDNINYLSRAPIYFVHIAPPTAILNGKYALASHDLVINGMGTLSPGSTPKSNIDIPPSAADKTGHGFLETYWNKSTPAFVFVRGLIAETLDAH